MADFGYEPASLEESVVLSVTMQRSALDQLLQIARVEKPAADHVSFTGTEPVFPTRYRVGTAGAAALAAVGAGLLENVADIAGLVPTTSRVEPVRDGDWRASEHEAWRQFVQLSVQL